MPRISILIPTYNRSNYLCEAIESVLLQSYKDIEIIVIDDGSTDDTYVIIKQFSNQVLYVYQSNRGVSAARNHAFHLSSGQYILMLDSDDLLLPNALEKLSKVLDEQPEIDLVYGDGFICDEEGKTTGRWSEFWKNTFDELLENVIVYNSLPTNENALMRREILEKLNGPFDEMMVGYEDWDLAINLAAIRCRVLSIPDPVCKYRIHAGSKSLPNSQWASKRHESLVRSRFKVLNAPWFNTLSLQARKIFFNDLLINILRSEYPLQDEVLNHANFKILPGKIRAELFYKLTIANRDNNYIMKGDQRRMSEAIKLSPTDIRLYLLLILTFFGTRVWMVVRSFTGFFTTIHRNEKEDAVTKALKQ